MAGANASMPSTAMPVGELAEHVGQARVIVGQLLGPVPHGGGEQQLAAGRCPQPVGGLQAPLVGHPELADLLDLVAEELDPQRMLLRGGNTSTMPPRTAISPRRSTRSVRV
jgi:hypothetical protein